MFPLLQPVRFNNMNTEMVEKVVYFSVGLVTPLLLIGKGEFLLKLELV